ncbi:MAG: hypothetical protein DMG76_14355 [Acidobacteria bacterium]|nr:MAG: hypothetical protein DMG76_14355 [Acidobacteriota bacterium]
MVASADQWFGRLWIHGYIKKVPQGGFSKPFLNRAGGTYAHRVAIRCILSKDGPGKYGAAIDCSLPSQTGPPAAQVAPSPR